VVGPLTVDRIDHWVKGDTPCIHQASLTDLWGYTIVEWWRSRPLNCVGRTEIWNEISASFAPGGMKARHPCRVRP